MTYKGVFVNPLFAQGKARSEPWERRNCTAVALVFIHEHTALAGVNPNSQPLVPGI
jgi:hypothetical protein